MAMLPEAVLAAGAWAGAGIAAAASRAATAGIAYGRQDVFMQRLLDATNHRPVRPAGATANGIRNLKLGT